MDERPDQQREVLAALTAAWLDGLASPRTEAAYRADLRRFGHWAADHGVDPLDLDEADLRAYRTACEADGSSASTVARRLSALASFSEFAYSRGHGNGPPDIERPVAPKRSTTDVLTAEDARALVAAADRTSLRSGLVVRLLLLDGLKVGEAVRIDAADIAGCPPDVTLVLGGPQPRALALHADTAAVVCSYLGSRQDGPLLLSDHSARRTQRLTRYGVDFIVKRAAIDAGITTRVSANTLRRFFVIAARARGDDLDAIRRHVGHGDARTTRRYLEEASTARHERSSRAPPNEQ